MTAEDTAPKSGLRPAQRFTDFVHARRTKKDLDRPPDNKLWARKVADACNVSVPNIYKSFEKIEDIFLDDLPETFVLKPLHLTSRRGVFILRRKGNAYFDRMSSAVLTPAAIRERIEELFRHYPRRRRTVVAEEFVETTFPIPLDYKFFMFGDEIAFIAHQHK